MNNTTTNNINDNQVRELPIENEANLLQNEAPDNLLTQSTNLEDKLIDLEAALQAFTPLDDALAAFGITHEEFNCYLDTLGTDAESYLKQQYGLGLVSFRSNLATLAATKPTAAVRLSPLWAFLTATARKSRDFTSMSAAKTKAPVSSDAFLSQAATPLFRI